MNADAPWAEQPLPALSRAQEDALCEDLRRGRYDAFALRLEQALLDMPLALLTQQQLRRVATDALLLIRQHVDGLLADDRAVLDGIPQEAADVLYDHTDYVRALCARTADFLSGLRQRFPPSLSMETVVSRVAAYILAHFTQPIELSVVAAQHGISYPYLSTLYKRYHGISPSRHILTLRVERAKALVADNPSTSFKQIAAMVGYEDAHYFSRLFRSVTGLSLSEYRSSL